MQTSGKKAWFFDILNIQNDIKAMRKYKYPYVSMPLLQKSSIWQGAVFRVRPGLPAKGLLLAFNMPPFTMRKVTFYSAISHLLQQRFLRLAYHLDYQ